MKVILKQYVYKHGVAGDVINVADGFARNYLLPRGLAVKATKRAIDENQGLVAEAALRRNELNEQLMKVAGQIDGVHLVFGRKAGSNNKLYGSVTTTEIAEALLEKTGIDINRRRISDRGLRELGSFDIPVRMGNELNPILKVTIVREDDLQDYLRMVEGVDEEAAEAPVEVAAEAEVEEVPVVAEEATEEETA